MNLTSRDAYWFRVMVAASLLFGAILGADFYQPACALAWERRKRPGPWGAWARSTIWLMDWLEPDHCRRAAMIHRRLMARSRHRDLCSGCGKEIDESTCWCGDAIDKRGTWHDNHPPVPMGCECYRVESA